MISWTWGLPIVLTIPWPFQSSQTSCEVDDINCNSTVPRFSLALPITALSQAGPPTRIAATMVVSMPNGAIAKTIWSNQPTAHTHILLDLASRTSWVHLDPNLLDSLMNCCANCSPNRDKRLIIHQLHSVHVPISQFSELYRLLRCEIGY